MRFKALGIRFSVSFWFTALVTLYALYFENALRVLLAVILHESAHIIAICLFGASVSEINLKMTDIRICAETHSQSKGKRITIALAGPMANLAGCGSSYLFGDELFFGINLVIAVFQLLPCAGTDGGGVLSILLGKHASKQLKILSVVFASVVVLLGILLLKYESQNVSLLAAGFYLFFMACK